MSGGLTSHGSKRSINYQHCIIYNWEINKYQLYSGVVMKINMNSNNSTLFGIAVLAIGVVVELLLYLACTWLFPAGANNFNINHGWLFALGILELFIGACFVAEGLFVLYFVGALVWDSIKEYFRVMALFV